MVAMAKELWQQRSWLGASDSAWLYFSLSLPPSVSRPQFFASFPFYSFLLQSSPSLLFPSFLSKLQVWLFILSLLPDFHRFLLLLPSLVSVLQHSTTFNILLIDFLITPSPFAPPPPLLFSPTLLSVPSIPLSFLWWPAAHQMWPTLPAVGIFTVTKRGTEMELNHHDKQGVTILIIHVRSV